MPVNCVGLELEKIRGIVKIGGITIRTPFVQSISIQEARGKLSATFSCSVEVRAGTQFIPGTDIELYAGLKGNEDLILTGQVRSLTINPSPDKAGYYIFQMQGANNFVNLENKRFSRRLRSDGFSVFVSIESGATNRPNKGFSTDKRVRGGKHTWTSSKSTPTKSDHSNVIKMPKRGSGKHGNLSKASHITGGEKTGTGESTVAVHDHSSMSKGGASFGVFSAD